MPELLLPCRERRCERCCYSTQMPLSNRDLQRLEALGYRRDDFAVYENGKWRLRNINGHCYFLKPGKGCRIYPHRPVGCRIYPAVCVEGHGIAVDAYCPLALLALRKLAENPTLLERIARVISSEFRVDCPPRLIGVIHTGEE